LGWWGQSQVLGGKGKPARKNEKKEGKPRGYTGDGKRKLNVVNPVRTGIPRRGEKTPSPTQTGGKEGKELSRQRSGREGSGQDKDIFRLDQGGRGGEKFILALRRPNANGGGGGGKGNATIS